MLFPLWLREHSCGRAAFPRFSWPGSRSLAATGALIRSQFRPKLRYRTPARGMGVQRARKTQGGFRPPSFVHAALRPASCSSARPRSRLAALRRSRAWAVREVREFLSGHPAFPWAGNSTGPLWRPPIPWAGTSVTALGHSRGGFFVPVDVYPVHRGVARPYDVPR